MRIYSAGEAIGPAWEHTKGFLRQDRRWPRILKICAVAFLAQLGNGINFNVPGRSGRHGGTPGLPHGLQAGLAAFAVLIGFTVLLLGFALLYFGSRLQFVLFDMVVLRDDRVAPSWRRHGPQTWRWIGVKLAAAAGLGVVLSPLLVPAIVGFVRLTSSPKPAASLGPGAAFAMLGLFGEFFLAILVFVLLLRLFTQLALPALALENLRFGAVFARAWLLFRSDVPGMLLYFLLQPLVLFGFSLAIGFGFVLAIAIPVVPLALLGWALWALLHGSTAGIVVLSLLGIVAGLVFLIYLLGLYLFATGVLGVFTQAWSLYFLGGRYPLLGSYLQPEPEPRLGFPEGTASSPAL